MQQYFAKIGEIVHIMPFCPARFNNNNNNVSLLQLQTNAAKDNQQLLPRRTVQCTL